MISIRGDARGGARSTWRGAPTGIHVAAMTPRRPGPRRRYLCNHTIPQEPARDR